MATVFKKTFTKPVPADAETFTRKGEQFARWRDAKDKTRTEKPTPPPAKPPASPRGSRKIKLSISLSTKRQ
ncbi:MAG: hypothetical protein NTX50_31630 [Candidatus Sumerlaeota bacterium]|nr:hypothetical protein [Candidatus Sumerlaeota bacterium]